MHAVKTKPVLLVFPFGLLSHYLRSLVLCRQLRNDFEIKIANNPAFSSFITQEAFASFECDSLNANRIIEAMKKFNFSWLNTPDLENIFGQQVRVIREMRPAVVLGDNSITLKMAAEATGVVYVSLMNGYMSKYYAGTRDISKTHPAYPLVKLLPISLQAVLTTRGEAAAFRFIHHSFKTIRKKHNLSRRTSYLDEMEGDITVICDLPEFFPQSNLPGEYLQLAPLVYSPPKAREGSLPSRDRRKKTIFVSMGSSGDWKKVSFLNHLYFEKYNVIASGDVERSLHAPHISHVPFVDIRSLFPSTDLVICHGGNGTVYQALLYEIPLLCYSTHCEQEWNVAVLEKCQLAKSLNEITNIEALVRITEEWITKKGNQSFSTYSQKIGREISRLPGMAAVIATEILKRVQLQTKNSYQPLST